MKKTVINYDEENDVLYVNFRDPPLEADSSERYGDFIIRYKNGETIGVTILSFMDLKRQKFNKKMTNSRFKEIYEALHRIIAHTSNKHIWNEAEYIEKHLYKLEEEYQHKKEVK